MEKETQERLFRDYAQFFPNRVDVQRSSMIWGFTCGEGWARLVEAPLHYATQEIAEWHRIRRLKEDLVAAGTYKPEGEQAWLEYAIRMQPKPPYRRLEVTQVKEKFGELRFYYQGDSDRAFSAVVQAVTWLSSVTCESCGRAAKHQSGPAATARCDACRDIEVKRNG